jgi:hypothetical protein
MKTIYQYCNKCKTETVHKFKEDKPECIICNK